MRLYRCLLLAATLLACGVIALGAYVRLSDAGLGCPDWPGCYGHWLGVPAQAVDSAKAWKEMVHRYFAGSLGLLILALCLLSWRGERRRHRSPALPTLLLVIVGLQAALGMWTVTLLLKPLVVTLHLLGGMATLSLLVGLAVSGGERAPAPVEAAVGAGLRALAAAALFACVAQIALGGWVSSNYAALACPDLPTCQGQWRPAMDFAQAFSVHRELGQTAAGELLPATALTAIHWTHRLGAGVLALLAGALAVALQQSGERRWRNWGRLLLGLLLLQLGLGVANVLLALPLPLALAHTLGAAALLSALLSVNLRLQRAARPAVAAAGKTSAGRRGPPDIPCLGRRLR